MRKRSARALCCGSGFPFPSLSRPSCSSYFRGDGGAFFLKLPSLFTATSRSPVTPPNKVLGSFASLRSSAVHNGSLRSPPLFQPPPLVIAHALASSFTLHPAVAHLAGSSAFRVLSSCIASFAPRSGRSRSSFVGACYVASSRPSAPRRPRLGCALRAGRVFPPPPPPTCVHAHARSLTPLSFSHLCKYVQSLNIQPLTTVICSTIYRTTLALPFYFCIVAGFLFPLSLCFLLFHFLISFLCAIFGYCKYYSINIFSVWTGCGGCYRFYLT